MNNLVRKFFAWTGLLILACIGVYGILYFLTPISKNLPDSAYITLEDAPTIGQWMYTSEKEPAHWLGQEYLGKELREPINVVVIDRKAASITEAESHFMEACQVAGYVSRTGHSSGYQALIGGAFFSQLPREEKHAFSDALFIYPNNHGRAFGLYEKNGVYYITAAFSRENIDLFADVKHGFVSFNEARDDFAVRMSENTDYKIMGKLDLKNACLPTQQLTTADHDGAAIVLVRK